MTGTEHVPTIANPVYRGETCRACQTELVFVQTPKGKREPLERQPLIGDQHLSELSPAVFRVVVILGGQARSLGVKAAGELNVDLEQAPLYVSHFATCPERDKFRRGR